MPAAKRERSKSRGGKPYARKRPRSLFGSLNVARRLEFGSAAANLSKAVPGSSRMAPVPKVLKARLTYRDLINLNAGAGYSNAALHGWSANSAFDPDATTGGHQPLGYDQLQLFYDVYRVLKATIVVTCHGTDKDLTFGLLKADTIGTSTDMLAITEQTQSVYETIKGNATDVKRVMMTWDAKKDAGEKTANDKDMAAGFGSNPSTRYYFTLFCANPAYSTQAQDPAICNFDVEIIYDIECSSRKILAQS